MHKILVVEKDNNLRFLYKLVLTKEGYDVLTVSTKAEALEKLRGMDLVISELESPENSIGCWFESYYLTNEKIKVIVNTGYPLDSDLEFDCPVDAVLPKSSDLAELKNTIQHILQSPN